MDNHKSSSDVPKTEPTVLTFEAMNSEIDPGNANYQQQVKSLNDSMQEVGMGRHQWYFLTSHWISNMGSWRNSLRESHRGLFVVTGFGYFSRILFLLLFWGVLPSGPGVCQLSGIAQI
jgi:hypothetical protein